MNQIKLGQYIYGTSPIHLLDPRTKIICCTLTVIAILACHNLFYLSGFFLFTMIIVKISGISFVVIFRSLRGIRYLLLITFIFQGVLTPGVPIFSIGSINISYEGVMLGTINLMRLVILYFSSLILLMTTSPLKFSAGLEYLLLPLDKVKIPVYYITTVVNISFRFIPTLVEEVNIVKDAQSSRGAPFDSPHLLIRLKSYLAVLIPLLASSLLRAEELAEAMDSRCYSNHFNRYRMNALTFKAGDILSMFLLALVSLIGLMLTVYNI